MFKRYPHLVPVGFPTVLEGFVKAAMKKRPSNIGVFAWYYFMELIAYKAENETFDLSTLIQEFHKNKADRISGNGFEEELKKKGYTVSSNVNHDFNELIINGELDWLSWDSTSNNQQTNNNHVQVPVPSVSASSPDTNRTTGRSTTETRHKVHPKGNEKKKDEDEKRAPSAPLKGRKETDVSAQNGQNVSITNTGEKTRGKLNAGAAEFNPMMIPPVRRTKSAEAQSPRKISPGDRSSFHPVHKNPIRQIGAKQETKSTASGISGEFAVLCMI
ncbi:uncharacterized protein LOC134466492 [Engraulis encrasicolus]|uniref:uncharacterized protein LOC134466492 n=1 Tax=Engraulis encrasicolus TaxID=184585 RepID=UPI002FD3B7FD